MCIFFLSHCDRSPCKAGVRPHGDHLEDINLPDVGQVPVTPVVQASQEHQPGIYTASGLQVTKLRQETRVPTRNRKYKILTNYSHSSTLKTHIDFILSLSRADIEHTKLVVFSAKFSIQNAQRTFNALGNSSGFSAH